MATRTLTALYDTRMQAETARQHLLEAGVPDDSIKVEDASGASTDRAHLDALPDEDRHAYEEGIARGGFLVTVHADGDYDEEAIRVLEETPAMDFEERQSQWRESGWTGYRPSQGAEGLGASAPPVPSTNNFSNDSADAAIEAASIGASSGSQAGAAGSKKRGGKKATTVAVAQTDMTERSMTADSLESGSARSSLASTAGTGDTIEADPGTPPAGLSAQPSTMQAPLIHAVREDRGSKRVRSYAYDQARVSAPLPVDQQMTMEPAPPASEPSLPERAFEAEAGASRGWRQGGPTLPPVRSETKRSKQPVGSIAAILGLIAVAAAAFWAARSRGRRNVQTAPDLYRVIEVDESDQLRPDQIVPHDVGHDAGAVESAAPRR